MKTTCSLLAVVLGTASFFAASAAPISITRITAPIVPATGLPSVPDFSISMAATAKWMVFGSPNDNAGQGSALLYNAATGTLVRKLTAADGVAGDDFGRAVAISGDNIIIGAPGRNTLAFNDTGRLYIFNANTGAQLRFVGFIDGVHGPDARLGDVLVAEGDFVVAGMPGFNSQQGHVYVIRISTGQLVSDLRITGGATGDYTGNAVGISGHHIIVGSPLRDNASEANPNGGAVYVFDRDAGTQLYEILPPTSNAAGLFGYTIAVEGTRALIGSPNKTSNQGAASIYDLNSNVEIASLVLPANTLQNNDAFGTALALRGGLAVVSAPVANSYAGRVFTFDSRTGEYLRELPTSGALSSDKFGQSLAFSPTALLIGVAGSSIDRASALLIRSLAAPLPGSVIASSGSSASGVIGATYASFPSATLGYYGASNVVATLKAGVGTPSGATKGAWSDVAGTFSLLLRTGQIIGSAGNSITDVSVPVMNTSDRLLLPYVGKGPSFPAANASPTIFRDTGVVFGMPFIGTIFGMGTTFLQLNAVAQSHEDTYHETALLCALKLGTGTTAASDSGICVQADTSFTLTEVARESDTVNSDVLGQIDRVTFNWQDAVFHAAVVGTAKQGLYNWNRGTHAYTTIARGTAPSTVPNATYAVFISETNAKNDTLFRATLKNTATPADNEALFEFTGGSTTTLLVKNEPSVVGTGIKQDKLLGYWSSNFSYLLHTTVKGTGVTAANDGCLIFVPSSGHQASAHARGRHRARHRRCKDRHHPARGP